MRKLCRPSTDRPPLTATQALDVNIWRAKLKQLVAQPEQWGVDMPEGFPGPIPDELQLAADETPLHYVPKTKGTYRLEDGSMRTFVAGLHGLYSVCFIFFFIRGVG